MQGTHVRLNIELDTLRDAGWRVWLEQDSDWVYCEEEGDEKEVFYERLWISKGEHKFSCWWRTDKFSAYFWLHPGTPCKTYERAIEAGLFDLPHTSEEE